MNKKEYMKPTMMVVEIMESAPLLAGSTQGLNEQLQEETVDYGW